MSEQSEFPVRSTVEILKLEIRGRCPRCGHGSVFKSYLKITDSCPVCRLGLEGHDVGDGPVVPAILLIGGIVSAMAFYTEIKYQPPYWLHAVLWLPMIVVATMVTLPAIKGIAIALQHRFRSTDEPGNIGGR